MPRYQVHASAEISLITEVEAPTPELAVMVARALPSESWLLDTSEEDSPEVHTIVDLDRDIEYAVSDDEEEDEDG